MRENTGYIFYLNKLIIRLSVKIDYHKLRTNNHRNITNNTTDNVDRFI